MSEDQFGLENQRITQKFPHPRSFLVFRVKRADSCYGPETPTLLRKEQTCWLENVLEYLIPPILAHCEPHESGRALNNMTNFTVHGEIASARLPCAMLEVGMVGTGLRNPFRVSLVLLFSKVSSVSSTHKPPLRITPKTRRERECQTFV